MATNVTYFPNGDEMVTLHTFTSTFSRTSSINWIVPVGDYYFGIVEWTSAGRPESSIIFGTQSVNVPFGAASVMIFFLALCAMIIAAALIYRARHRRRGLSQVQNAA